VCQLDELLMVIFSDFLFIVIIFSWSIICIFLIEFQHMDFVSIEIIISFDLHPFGFKKRHEKDKSLDTAISILIRWLEIYLTYDNMEICLDEWISNASSHNLIHSNFWVMISEMKLNEKWLCEMIDCNTLMRLWKAEIIPDTFCIKVSDSSEYAIFFMLSFVNHGIWM